jgi:hypothetical protein
MRKSWITLGVLAACVAALGLFVWLTPPQTQRNTTAVATLKPAGVRALRVQFRGKTVAVLERRDAEWLLVDPVKAPADAFQVLRVLAVLDARSTAQYPTTDAARFDLDPPQTELIIDGQRFGFGAINTVTREQYLLAQNQIHAVETRYATAIPTNANALIRRSIFAAGETPVRFDFGAFNVSHDGNKWSVTPQKNNEGNKAGHNDGDISQDDFNRWAAQWREGSALRAAVTDASGSDAAKAAPREIFVTLKNGTKIPLAIVQEQPELVVRRADLGLQFTFTGDIGRQMMSAPPARK